MTEPALLQISEHVYWMPPQEPVRPSLCAVVGTRRTLMLDAGASDAHARQFLDGLAALDIPTPHQVVLTHWHWDHVFGAAEIGVAVIAHTETAQALTLMAAQDWSDAGLEQHIQNGNCPPTVQTAYGKSFLSRAAYASKKPASHLTAGWTLRWVAASPAESSTLAATMPVIPA